MGVAAYLSMQILFHFTIYIHRSLRRVPYEMYSTMQSLRLTANVLT